MRILGVTRKRPPATGGFTRKIQLIANANGLPMKAEISGGEVSDHKGFDLLRIDPLNGLKVAIADEGCNSDHVRGIFAANGGSPVIAARANRKAPEPVDRITCALRNLVERRFGNHLDECSIHLPVNE